MGAQGASQAPGLPRHVQAQPVLSAASVRLSALRPPFAVGFFFTTRAQSRRGNKIGCLTS
jgi:hypothetical protein